MQRWSHDEVLRRRPTLAHCSASLRNVLIAHVRGSMPAIYQYCVGKTKTRIHLLYDDASKTVRNEDDRPGLLILALTFSVESIKKHGRLIVYVRDGFAESGSGIVAIRHDPRWR